MANIPYAVTPEGLDLLIEDIRDERRALSQLMDDYGPDVDDAEFEGWLARDRHLSEASGAALRLKSRIEMLRPDRGKAESRLDALMNGPVVEAAE